MYLFLHNQTTEYIDGTKCGSVQCTQYIYSVIKVVVVNVFNKKCSSRITENLLLQTTESLFLLKTYNKDDFHYTLHRLVVTDI